MKTIVQLLNNANVGAQDVDGNTTLILVAMQGHLITFQTLYIQGANVKAQNNNGYTALNSKNPAIVQLIVNNNRNHCV